MTGAHISTSAEETQRQRGDLGKPSDTANIGASAALISFFTIISRITGFMRTWAMAFALGSTMLASSYQVAYNLPSMLYELVVGGMLVTAFLPVYVSVKNKLGKQGGSEYASNLLSIVFIVLGIAALLCTVFAPALIYTQSFMNDQNTMDDAVFFFRFFAIQIIFYGVSAIVSGLLNASRDYLWSSAAPIFNNVIVTATFVLYAFVSPIDSELAKLIIAVGNPFGVFVQMAIQIPALRRNGIRLRPRINLRDPFLKETLSIGVPAVIVMFGGMIIVSVQNAAAYAFLDNGPSVIAYARLWFTLPYAFLTVPITTALFTEIADMHTRGDMDGFKHAIVSGTNQILFFMVPFALYLIVFSEPLVTLYHIGAFTQENILQIALYLAALAISLPLYGVNTYLQKTFSALRAMKHFAMMMIAAAALQIGFIAVFLSQVAALPPLVGMFAVAFSETVYYLVLDTACFVYLRAKFGGLGMSSIARALALSLGLGLLGAAVGGGISFALSATVAPSDGSLAGALLRIVAGGVGAVVVTFGLAMKLNLPEAAFLLSIVRKAAGCLGRRTAPCAPEHGEEPLSGISAQPAQSWRESTAAIKAPSETKHAPRGKHAAHSALGAEECVEYKISKARHAALPSQTAPKHARHAAESPNNDRKVARARHAKAQR